MMKQRKCIQALITILLSMGFMSGCVNSRSLQNNVSDLEIGFDNKYLYEDTEKSNSQRAELIKNALKEIPEIEASAVVITGKTALIGISIRGDMREESNRIKAEAVKKAKAADKGIVNTAITSNDEIMEMIHNMEEQRLTSNS